MVHPTRFERVTFAFGEHESQGHHHQGANWSNGHHQRMSVSVVACPRNQDRHEKPSNLNGLLGFCFQGRAVAPTKSMTWFRRFKSPATNCGRHNLAFEPRSIVIVDSFSWKSATRL